MLKAVTRFGDPVEMTAGDARATAAALLTLAERLEPGTAGTVEPDAAPDRRGMTARCSAVPFGYTVRPSV
jgi:hypothetical protein